MATRLQPTEAMQQRTWSVLSALALATIVFATIVFASGCSSCNVDRRARAQGPDAGVHPGPLTTATCYVEAEHSTPLLQAQINELCLGAPNQGPVECFLAATRSLTITDPQKIALCHCATSTEPVVCYQRLQREARLLTSQIETMCSPTISQGLLANCRPVGGGYF